MSGKHYYLHVAHDAPSNFHNQQFGRHHGFQVELELRDRKTGALVEDEDVTITWELFYGNPDGGLPPVDRVENQDILVFLQRSTPHIKNGASSFKLRLKEVSKNHMKRKFQIKLFAEPEDLPSGVMVDPVYLNPIFVLSKVPRKFRSMYTEATVCAAMEVDGDSEASMLARRQMGMQSRGKPVDRVTAASVLAATKALGSDAPEIKHDLMAIAKQANANAPKPKTGVTPRKRTHAMMTEGGGIDPAILRWSFLCERQIRQLEWMEVPGTMHVACPVCKASYLSAAPFMKRRHLEGCTMGQCIQAMPNSLQIELRRMQNFGAASVAGAGFRGGGGSSYYKSQAPRQGVPVQRANPYQQYRGADTSKAPNHARGQRPQMVSPTSSATVSNLPTAETSNSFAGNFGSGIAGTAGMLQRNASFRLQNLQTLASMSNGSKGWIEWCQGRYDVSWIVRSINSVQCGVNDGRAEHDARADHFMDGGCDEQAGGIRWIRRFVDIRLNDCIIIRSVICGTVFIVVWHAAEAAKHRRSHAPSEYERHSRKTRQHFQYHKGSQ